VRALAKAAAVMTALACGPAVLSAARAQDVHITAPAPASGADKARKPLTPDQAALLSRALSADPAALAAAPNRSLHQPSLETPAAPAVNRTGKPDGSSTVAVKQPLSPDIASVDVDADVGADVDLAAPPVTVFEPGRPLPGNAAGNPGSGAARASVGLHNLASVDARVDPTNDQGKLGGTLNHSLPVGKGLSVSLQDSYSVTQTLSASAPPPATATPQIWDNEKSVKLSIAPTGTTLGADLATASNDPVTHQTLSADQKLYGPLHVTTAVSDLGEPSENKSITAGFMLDW
jgi:hypothetical protein